MYNILGELNLNAKWVWKPDQKHYIANEKKSQWWQEFNNGAKQSQFLFVQYNGSDVILVNQNLSIHVKLTQDKIFYSFSGINGFNKNPTIYMNGTWEIKPTITAKS